MLQDPFASLSPRLTVAAIVGEGLGIHHLGKNRAERLDLVSRALRDVDLDPAIGFRCSRASIPSWTCCEA